jgi:glucose-1-phosphate adenylyltransferase
VQYESHSLLRHLQRGWNFLRAELNEMVEALPAQQRVADDHWYRGTADAVCQNLDFIRQAAPSYIVVLAGDHVYKMDYSVMLRDHVEHGAGCTVGCIDVPRSEAFAFGVMAVDASRRITEFVEKPVDPPTKPGTDDRSLASTSMRCWRPTWPTPRRGMTSAGTSSRAPWPRAAPWRIRLRSRASST